MDHRAIEANEALLRGSIEAAKADGSDDALDVAAATSLQLAFLRPWLAFITENCHDGDRTVTAVTMVLGSMVAETARNATMRGEDGREVSVAEATIVLLERIAETAMSFSQGRGSLSETGVPVNLKKQADA